MNKISIFLILVFSLQAYAWLTPVVNGGSGGGISSINGDTTAAQIISGSANISVSSAGGTTTVSGAGLSPLAGSSSLTTVGTIASGEWRGTPVSTVYGGTGLSTLTTNNVILGNGAGSPIFVAPGSNGNILTSNGTTWTSAAAGSSGANTTLSNLGTVALNVTDFGAPAVSGTGADLNLHAGASTGAVGGNLNLKATGGSGGGIANAGLLQFEEADGSVWGSLDTSTGKGYLSLFSTATSGQRGIRIFYDNGGSSHWGGFSNNTTYGLVLDSNTSILMETGGFGHTILFTTNGSINVQTVGQGLQVAEGSNAKQGSGTDTCNGSSEVVVTNSSVTATSRIFLSLINHSGAPTGPVYESSKTAGTSFGFKCGAADTTSTVNWEIIEKGG